MNLIGISFDTEDHTYGLQLFEIISNNRALAGLFVSKSGILVQLLFVNITIM